jgi:NADH:ubiquinone oxidoreductase subunit E
MEKVPVKVCIGTTCYLLGASKLIDLENQLPEAWKGRVAVSGCTCLDLCDAEGVCNAPFVKVGDTVVSHATPISVMAAIADALGEPLPQEALS